MKKIQLTISCTEDNLYEAVCQVKALLLAIDAVSQEMEVKPKYMEDYTKWQKRWVHVTVNSSPEDLVKIYNLEKEVRELKAKEV